MYCLVGYNSSHIFRCKNCTLHTSFSGIYRTHMEILATLCSALQTPWSRKKRSNCLPHYTQDSALRVPRIVCSLYLDYLFNPKGQVCYDVTSKLVVTAHVFLICTLSYLVREGKYVFHVSMTGFSLCHETVKANSLQPQRHKLFGPTPHGVSTLNCIIYDEQLNECSTHKHTANNININKKQKGHAQ